MSIIKDLFNFDQVSDSIIGSKDIGEHDKSLKTMHFCLWLKNWEMEMFFRLFLLSGKDWYYAECENADMFIKLKTLILE